MSLTIDERSPKVMRSQEISPAAPARSAHTGLGSLCATVFAPCLAPGPGLARGREARAWGPHGDRRSVRDGPGGGAPLYERSSGPDPGSRVSAPREPDAVGLTDRAVGPPKRDDGARGRRYGRTSGWTEDHGARLIPGCGALQPAIRHPGFRPARGRDDAVGAGPLESSGVGVACSDGLVVARRTGHTTPPQHQCRWGPADDAASAPVAAGAARGPGRRWGLCRGVAGAGLCQTPRCHVLPLALGCGA
jgi:hypothetical protein